MQTFKLVFLVAFACGAIFGCRIFIRQIRQSFQQGYWRGRTGVAYRAASPKTFWFGICGLSFFATALALGACFLLVAAVFSS